MAAPTTPKQPRETPSFSALQQMCRRGDAGGLQELLQSGGLDSSAKELAELVSTAVDNGHLRVAKVLIEAGTSVLCADLRESTQLVASVFKRVAAVLDVVLSLTTTRVPRSSEASRIESADEEKKSEQDPLLLRCKSVTTQLLSLYRSLSQPRTVFVAIARSRHVLMQLERMLWDLDEVERELNGGRHLGSDAAAAATNDFSTAAREEDARAGVGVVSDDGISTRNKDWGELVAIRDAQLTFALEETRDLSDVLPDRPSQLEALTFLKYELDVLAYEATGASSSPSDSMDVPNEFGTTPTDTETTTATMTATMTATWWSEILQTAFEKASKYCGVESGAVRVPKWFVPPYMVDWQPEQFVGEGSFGSVHLGRLHEQRDSQDPQTAVGSSAPVAVKKLKMFGLGGARSDRAFLRDVNVWHDLSCDVEDKEAESDGNANTSGSSHNLHHPCILKLLGACHVSRRALLVLESAEHGNLLDYLQHQEQQQQQSASSLKLMLEKFVDAAEALQYLHSRKVVHGHLRCANIVVTGDGRAKLTDFGFDDVRSAVCAQGGPVLGKTSASSTTPSSSSHSLQWMAPELLVGGGGDGASFASDVYALGMCMLEAITLGPPWGNIEESQLLSNIEAGDLPPCFYARYRGYREMWELVAAMCSKMPSDRIPLKDVISGLQKLIDNVDKFEDMRWGVRLTRECRRYRLISSARRRSVVQQDPAFARRTLSVNPGRGKLQSSISRALPTRK